MILCGVFGWERRVRKLRKRWDRLREKADRKHGPVRAKALNLLDAINSNVTTMEERQLSRIDRARMAKDVEISLEEVRELLKMKNYEERAAASA
jgi:hypothetical protein